MKNGFEMHLQGHRCGSSIQTVVQFGRHECFFSGQRVVYVQCAIGVQLKYQVVIQKQELRVHLRITQRAVRVVDGVVREFIVVAMRYHDDVADTHAGN